MVQIKAIEKDDFLPLWGLVDGATCSAKERRDLYFIAEQPAPAPHLAHPEGCAALRIVLVTVSRVSRSCDNFPDGFDLHLLQRSRENLLCSGLRVQGLGFRVQGPGLMVEGLMAHPSRFRAYRVTFLIRNRHPPRTVRGP